MTSTPKTYYNIAKVRYKRTNKGEMKMRAKDYRLCAWEKLRGNWGTAALTAFVYSVLLGLCSLPSAVPAIAFLGAALTLLVGAPLAYGFAIFILKLADGERASTEILFRGFSSFGRAVLLQLIINIFVALWTLLFIVPGIIKAYSYSMSRFLAIEKPDLSANEARKESMVLMNGHKWELFCLDFSFIGWWLLCILTLGILSFWIIPYTQAARAEFFRRLMPKAREEQEETEFSPEG